MMRLYAIQYHIQSYENISQFSPFIQSFRFKVYMHLYFYMHTRIPAILFFSIRSCIKCMTKCRNCEVFVFSSILLFPKSSFFFVFSRTLCIVLDCTAVKLSMFRKKNNVIQALLDLSNFKSRSFSLKLF